MSLGARVRGLQRRFYAAGSQRIDPATERFFCEKEEEMKEFQYSMRRLPTLLALFGAGRNDQAMKLLKRKDQLSPERLKQIAAEAEAATDPDEFKRRRDRVWQQMKPIFVRTKPTLHPPEYFSDPFYESRVPPASPAHPLDAGIDALDGVGPPVDHLGWESRLRDTQAWGGSSFRAPRSSLLRGDTGTHS